MLVRVERKRQAKILHGKQLAFACLKVNTYTYTHSVEYNMQNNRTMYVASLMAEGRSCLARVASTCYKYKRLPLCSRRITIYTVKALALNQENIDLNPIFSSRKSIFLVLRKRRFFKIF